MVPGKRKHRDETGSLTFGENQQLLWVDGSDAQKGCEDCPGLAVPNRAGKHAGKKESWVFNTQLQAWLWSPNDVPKVTSQLLQLWSY